ncbi:hypothetical protein HMSSN036_44720 [Paenibacillus macerans]|nr:hypothetical protein HMSSN036_44720 [Paenibacillus macerans]
MAKQYVVDGLEGIQDPRGMIGVRLEVEATIITGAKTAIHNLLRCVEKSGLKVRDLVLLSLGAGQLALSKDEKPWVRYWWISVPDPLRSLCLKAARSCPHPRFRLGENL